MPYSDERNNLWQVETSPGQGRGREVSNSTGYRSADSWRAGEEGDIPLRSCCGMARAMGRGGEEGRGRRGS